MTSQRCSTAVSQVSRLGRVEEVGEHEDEAAGGDLAPVLEEMLERTLDVVRRRTPPRGVEAFLPNMREPPLPARRQPVRLTVGRVDVADEAAHVCDAPARTISSVVRMAAPLSSQGSGGLWKRSSGLRSATMTTRGASSA